MRVNNIVFRMENAEFSARAESLNPQESIEAAQEAAAAVGEADMVTGDTDAHFEAVDEAIAGIVELDAVTDELSVDIDSGAGIAPDAVEHVAARMESALRRAGFSSRANPTVRLRKESFGGSSSRLASTRKLRQESDNWAVKIWKMVVDAFNWLKDQVTGMYAKFTNNAKGIQKRLEDLGIRIGKLPSTGRFKESRIKVGGAKNFSIDGKSEVTNVTKIADDLAKFKVVADRFKETFGKGELGAILDPSKGFGSTIDDEGSNKTLKGGDTIGTKEIEDMLDPFNTAIGGVFNFEFSKTAPDFKNDALNKDTPNLVRTIKDAMAIDFSNPDKRDGKKWAALRLPRGRSLVASVQKISISVGTAVTAKFSVEVIEDRIATEFEIKDVNNTNEARLVVETGTTIIDELVKSESSSENLKSALKSVADNIEAFAKRRTTSASSDKIDNQGIRAYHRVVAGAFNALNATMRTIIADIPRMQFDFGAGAADVAAAMISSWKEDK